MPVRRKLFRYYFQRNGSPGYWRRKSADLLFDKDMLITTQNIKLGNLRIRERLMDLEHAALSYETLVEEFIRNEIISFRKIHLKDRKIENVILIGDYLPDILVNYAGEERVIRKEQFMDLYRKIIKKSPMELAMLLNVPLENATLMPAHRHYLPIFSGFSGSGYHMGAGNAAYGRYRL